MIEPMATARRERGEVKRASQAFRDLALVLFLLMLALSVRFQADEVDPDVKPLLGGVQAAGPELGGPEMQAIPAAVPALASPEPAEVEAPPIARLRELRHNVEWQTNLETLNRIEAQIQPGTPTRVLVFLGDEVHEIRLPVDISLPQRKSGCSKPKIDVQVHS
jgi:hypothetical protein